LDRPAHRLIVSGPDRGPRWEQIVAREANKVGLNITPSSVKAMKEVFDAPQTKAKVERGEVPNVVAAHAAALAEKGKPPSTEIVGVSVSSVNKRLGQCIEHLNAILAYSEMPTGGRAPNIVSERLNEIETLLPQVRNAMRQRKVIS
jgi:hypothetical protein